MSPQLVLRFARDLAGRTYLARQRATHPFHLCRTLYRPDDPPGLPTLYVQGCSGGLFEGDRWSSELTLGRGASAHVTTAAATLVHRMPHGGRARQALAIDVGPGALLEFFPDPLILFSGSRLDSRTVIRVAPGARLIAIDSFLPHRLPDDAAPFVWFDSEVRVEDERGGLVARERYRALGSASSDETPGVTGALLCQASVLVVGAGAAPLGPLRSALGGHAFVRAGASLLPDGSGVLARVLAGDGARLRAVLQLAWAAARGALGIGPGRARPK